MMAKKKTQKKIPVYLPANYFTWILQYSQTHRIPVETILIFAIESAARNPDFDRWLEEYMKAEQKPTN